MVNEEESVYFVEIFLIVCLMIYEIVKKIYIRTIDSPLVLSAETANRICIEVSDRELNRCCECPIQNIPLFGHMSEYAIDVRFALESSHLRVLPPKFSGSH